MSRARPDRPLAGRLAWLTLGLVLTGQFLDDALALARPFLAAEAPARDLLPPPFGFPQEEKEERETTTVSVVALPARHEHRQEGADATAPADAPVPAPPAPSSPSPAPRPNLLTGAGVFRRC